MADNATPIEPLIDYFGYVQFYLRLDLDNDRIATVKYECDFADAAGMPIVAKSVRDSAIKFYQRQYGATVVSTKFITKKEYEKIKGEAKCIINSDDTDTVTIQIPDENKTTVYSPEEVAAIKRKAGK